jgi:2'-5' RNA ligase
MQAVVSALDSASQATVRHLWDGIADEFGIQMPFSQPIPHFTFHVADKYQDDRLTRALVHAAARHPPFTVQAAGLGLFTGKKIVAHVPLVRNEALNALHRDLWEGLAGVGVNAVQHFDPRLWIPHVTLAYKGLTPDVLPSVVRWLADRSFAWEMTVDHVGVIAPASDPHTEALDHIHPLRG